VNKVSERNVRFFKLLISGANGDAKARKILEESDEIELYGHTTAKRIISLVRLYFPELSQIHQSLFAAEREMNGLAWSLLEDNTPKIDELITACGNVGHMIRLMEKEIIDNRDRLLKSKLIFRRYRVTSNMDKKAVPAWPEGSPFIRERDDET